jgi:hypothetical protein
MGDLFENTITKGYTIYDINCRFFYQRVPFYLCLYLKATDVSAQIKNDNPNLFRRKGKVHYPDNSLYY